MTDTDYQRAHAQALRESRVDESIDCIRQICEQAEIAEELAYRDRANNATTDAILVGMLYKPTGDLKRMN